jgi:hypothetical protein
VRGRRHPQLEAHVTLQSLHEPARRFETSGVTIGVEHQPADMRRRLEARE